jgi:hypothetical protein
MQYKINEQWLRGLDGPERDEMKNLVINNTKLLDKLTEILYNIQVKKEDTVLEDYDSPSWSHKQAHINGEIAAIKRVLEIISINERADRPNI